MAVPNTAQIVQSNEASGAYTPVYAFEVFQTGNITASVTNESMFVADAKMFPKGGYVVNVVLMCQGGADASNPLNLVGIVKKNGTDVCSTDPKVDKTAGTGNQSTTAAATGITQAVVKTDGTQQFAAGDFFTGDFTITRTTPGTEMAQPKLIVFVSPYKN